MSQNDLSLTHKKTYFFVFHASLNFLLCKKRFCFLLSSISLIHFECMQSYLFLYEIVLLLQQLLFQLNFLLFFLSCAHFVVFFFFFKERQRFILLLLQLLHTQLSNKLLQKWWQAASLMCFTADAQFLILSWTCTQMNLASFSCCKKYSTSLYTHLFRRWEAWQCSRERRFPWQEVACKIKVKQE